MADTGIEFKRGLKSKFRINSLKSLDEFEKLSLLLCYGTSCADVRPDAGELLDRFGSFRAVIDATRDELSASEMSESAATFLLLLKECAGAYMLGSLLGRGVEPYSGLIDYLHLTLSAERVEKFLAVYLDSKGLFLTVETLHEGTINRTAVYPRKAIELAIAHRASSVIFVHNHPSGDPTPSSADIELGVALEKAAVAVNLRVIDHIVIGQSGYYSDKESALLKSLR